MPVNTRQRKRYGPSGLGEVRLYKDGSAKVFLAEDENAEAVPYDILEEDLPDGVEAIKDVYIQLTPDETSIDQIRPWSGTYPSRFIGFIKNRNNVPVLKQKPARHVGPLDDGREWDVPAQSQFYALCEVISDDKHNGMDFMYTLRYMFERDQFGGVEIVWEYKSWYEDLINFLRLSGFDLGTQELMPGEPAAILTQLEEIMQDADTTFNVKFERGWPKELSELAVAARRRK